MNVAELRNTLNTYCDLLRGQNKLSPVTIRQYRRYLRHSLCCAGGQLAYLSTVTPHEWPIAKNAIDWFATLTHDKQLADDLRMLRSPRKPPSKPVQIPDLDTWRALGDAALREKPPFSCVLWLQLFSGLRISDILELKNDEVITAATTGRTTMHQKGPMHKARRDWIPGPLCLPTVQYLARMSTAPDGKPTWHTLFRLVHRSQEEAETRIRLWLPKPWHPHTFRHTVPSYLNELGFSLEDVASITGHQSLETLRQYIHSVSPRRTLAAQSALAHLLFGQIGPTNDGGLPDEPA